MEPKTLLLCSNYPTTGPCSEPNESSSTTFRPISPRSALILSSHLHLVLTSDLFPSGFPTKILYTFLISPMRATSPAHLILLDMVAVIKFSEAHKL